MDRSWLTKSLVGHQDSNLEPDRYERQQAVFTRFPFSMCTALHLCLFWSLKVVSLA